MAETLDVEPVADPIPESTPPSASPAEGSGTDGQTNDAVTWKYADGVAGVGEMPDWFHGDKYKTIEDQAKAANELRKKLGNKVEDAPESYELDYDGLGIDKDDKALTELAPIFKEMNLSQADYGKLIGKYVEIQQAQHAEFQKGLESAWDAFGPETTETMGRLNSWVSNNFDAEEQKLIKGFQSSPEEVRVLEKMRKGAPKSAPPTVNQLQSSNNFESSAKLASEKSQNWDKMKSDANYRADYDRRLAVARKNEANQML